MLQPNFVLSIIKVDQPLLVVIGKIDCKLFELMIESLFHFATNILGIKRNNQRSNGKDFLIQYFNYNQLKKIVGTRKFVKYFTYYFVCLNF